MPIDPRGIIDICIDDIIALTVDIKRGSTILAINSIARQKQKNKPLPRVDMEQEINSKQKQKQKQKQQQRRQK